MKYLVLASAVLLAGCETMPARQMSSHDLCRSFTYERVSEARNTELIREIDARRLDCSAMRPQLAAQEAQRQQQFQATQQTLQNMILLQQATQPQQRAPLIQNRICDTQYIGGMYRTQCY